MILKTQILRFIYKDPGCIKRLESGNEWPDAAPLKILFFPIAKIHDHIRLMTSQKQTGVRAGWTDAEPPGRIKNTLFQK